MVRLICIHEKAKKKEEKENKKTRNEK